MFTQDTLAPTDDSRTARSGGHDRIRIRRAPRQGALALTDRPSPAKLRRIYAGQREVGHPTVCVVRENDTERLTAPGGFDWGWPSIAGTRRLAHAMLLDLTDREAPASVCTDLASDELAHLPWTAFSLTGRDLFEWIGARGYDIEDWPEARTSGDRLIRLRGGDADRPRPRNRLRALCA